MSRIRLLKTTALRLSLVYACAYSLLSAAGLGFIYWSTAGHVEAQIDARLRLETEVLLDRSRTRALPALREMVQQRSRGDGHRRIFFYRLRGPGGPALPEASGRQGYATLRLGEVFAIDPDREEADVPVRVLITALPGGYRLLVGRDLGDERRLLEHTLGVVLGVIAVTFLLAILASAWLGALTLRRIDAISRTAGEIIAGDLSRRIPIGARDDEFDALGRRLNAMLERIESLMAAMRQVTDNVAHDLRSPLSRLRNRLEVTLLEARREPEYREVIEKTIADADALLGTFNALLGIARAEAGVQRDDWTEVELKTLAEDLSELYGALAEDKGVELICRVDAAPTIRGHRQLLAQALSNLLDNAVKYTPAGGRIELVVAQTGGVPELRVADSGPGIPSAERERVLERFVRLDGARSSPGSGLGLSLVRAVAQLHDAQLRLADNRPGLRVSLRFGGRRTDRPR